MVVNCLENLCLFVTVCILSLQVLYQMVYLLLMFKSILMLLYKALKISSLKSDLI